MDEQLKSNYWSKRVISRRSLVRGAVIGGAGLAGASLLGCNVLDGDSGGTDGSKGGTLRSAPDIELSTTCLLYTSPSPRDATLSRMPSSA